MELIRGLHSLRARHRPCVASIGNFDGVHLGHQAIFRQVVDHARSRGVLPTVVLFEPQPEEFFGLRVARLTNLREKLAALSATGIAQVLCLRFDSVLSRLPAPEFVHRVLRDGLGVRHLVIGPDFRFGRGRAGDTAMLERLGGDWGMTVQAVPQLMQQDERVSSTALRAALAEGDLDRAERLLGRRYGLRGRVVHGDARGRTLGFPTANVPLRRAVAPLGGVYAAHVHGLGPVRQHAVVNIGTRPTVGGSFTLLEAHLIDFSGDLYGRHLHVEFVRRLRGEKKFAGLEALRTQIARDTDAARAVLDAG